MTQIVRVIQTFPMALLFCTIDLTLDHSLSLSMSMPLFLSLSLQLTHANMLHVYVTTCFVLKFTHTTIFDFLLLRIRTLSEESSVCVHILYVYV